MKRPTPFFPSEETGDMLLEDDDDAAGPGALKKRRLASDQVRALERCFEIENKLDPDRKSRLAQELCLQPRQVAVWFQNRRARWKTKQLERDFAALKSRYDSLRLDFDSLRRDNHTLLAELAELKSKFSADSEKKEEEKKEVGSSDSDSSVVITDDNRVEGEIVYQAQQMFKMEEESFFGGEEPCGNAFFSDEHVSNLSWLCNDLNGAGSW